MRRVLRHRRSPGSGTVVVADIARISHPAGLSPSRPSAARERRARLLVSSSAAAMRSPPPRTLGGGLEPRVALGPVGVRKLVADRLDQSQPAQGARIVSAVCRVVSPPERVRRRRVAAACLKRCASAGWRQAHRAHPGSSDPRTAAMFLPLARRRRRGGPGRVFPRTHSSAPGREALTSVLSWTAHLATGRGRRPSKLLWPRMARCRGSESRRRSDRGRLGSGARRA
jgi:hypothetical protein